jgi:flagellar hook assembly protein FlgD
VRTKEGTTAVAEGAETPTRNLQLGLSAPNPFAAATQFEYTSPAAGRHTLAVYDVQGREVAVLADREQAAGRYTRRWDGRDSHGRELPSGVYFLRLDAGGKVEMQKLVIAR